MPLGDDSSLAQMLAESARISIGGNRGSDGESDRKRDGVSSEADREPSPCTIAADDVREDASAAAQVEVHHQQESVASIELAQAVVRWLQFADGAYREMFHKRIKQLAQGQRSYALSKQL